MRKIFVLLILLCLLLTGCKKVVQKIPIDACTIPAHTEQRVWFSYTTVGKNQIPVPHYYIANVPTQYRICFRVVYDNDKTSVRWEECDKDEYDLFIKEGVN